MKTKFSIGDKIIHPKFGTGIIRKMDKKKFFPDLDFFYFVDFRCKGGDKTRVWLPKKFVEKKCKAA